VVSVATQSDRPSRHNHRPVHELTATRKADALPVSRTRAASFLIATTDGGCDNDATSDQASCINSFLRRALDQGKIAYFPAGVYAVGSTVNIPTGSVVQGSLWSQILGSGFYFSDMKNPKVMV
jgi:hypothetical protein